MSLLPNYKLLYLSHYDIIMSILNKDMFVYSTHFLIYVECVKITLFVKQREYRIFLRNSRLLIYFYFSFYIFTLTAVLIIFKKCFHEVVVF